MVSAPKLLSQAQTQKAKLASSYSALLDEFSSKELTNVGNYAVGNFIGKGSFGKVYLASHKLINGSKVVLKSANKEDSNLVREIHHHRQFLHPHIARLYEVILTESHVWLVLEYCPGDELYYYLTKHGPLEPEKVQKIFTQLLGAVSYVHQKSCVHRDLKLENILLDKNEDVKLCDFGFTREYEGKSSYLTTWCGTVCYSAPEMLKGEKYAGEKVDVWSLGVILYALLCGELPFDEDDEDKTKARILKEEPTYPETMPKPAKDLISSMLAKRPLLRPSLADIFLNPWLVDHAPHQQAILKLQQPPAFSTQLEKDVLHRMRSAGVNVDMVIENVLSQRCDALAGWWALLLEKEERKEKRRLRKRKEREHELKVTRRFSNASGRLIEATLAEVVEELSPNNTSQDLPIHRGRSPARANGVATAPTVQTVMEEQSQSRSSVHQQRRGHQPSTSSRTNRRSQLGPGYSSKRSSMMQIVATTDQNLDMGKNKKSRRKYQPVFLQNIRSWFKEASKRTKNPTPETRPDLFPPPAVPPKSARSGEATSQKTESPKALSKQPKDLPSEQHTITNLKTRPRITTPRSGSGHRRMHSHSPSPLTPNSSYRRTSGLRGRKSTSSSVSSIRSFAPAPGSAASAVGPGHHPSHSKASSTSSISMGSPSSMTASLGLSVVNTSTSTSSGVLNPHPISTTLAARRRSSPGFNAPYMHPGTSNVKVLPGQTSSSTPTASLTNGINSAGINGKRVPPRINLPGPINELSSSSAFSGGAPQSPGLPVFAKRKRSPFKGPMLGPGLPSPGMRRKSSLGLGHDGFGGVLDTSTLVGQVRRSNSGTRKSSDSSRLGLGARVMTVMEEDDEEEGEDGDEDYDDIEEVEAFSPVEEGNIVEWPTADEVFSAHSGAGGRHSVELESDRPLTKWEVEG